MENTVNDGIAVTTTMMAAFALIQGGRNPYVTHMVGDDGPKKVAGVLRDLNDRIPTIVNELILALERLS
jgi:hypothetical protein